MIALLPQLGGNKVIFLRPVICRPGCSIFLRRTRFILPFSQRPCRTQQETG
jgi:hypothetical protein